MRIRFTTWVGCFLPVAAAMASNINVSVQGPAGEALVNVPVGGTVNYRIVATLADNSNEGLALFGASLDFTGGVIDLQANSPAANPFDCTNPMRNFVIPEGITNPVASLGNGGFGGTMIGGDVIQLGGAQNTIKNDIGNADFPIGAVLTGVGKPSACGQATIATGSFTLPGTALDGQTYQLRAFDIFANIIQAGQDGTGAFWATEAAGVGTVTDLNVHVQSVVPNVTLVSSIPSFTGAGVASIPTNGTLWRNLRHVIRLTFSGALPGGTAPTAAQIEIVELLPNGSFGGNLLPGTFQLTVEGGTVVRIRESSTTATVLQDNHWYAIRNTGAWVGVANFEAQFPVNVGDADGNRFTTPADVGQVNATPNGAQPDQSRSDINGDGFKTPADVGIANANQGPPPPKPTLH